MKGGKTNKRQIGKWGEDQAVLFLRRQGYTIRARNFYSRFGEIDIVAEYAGSISFIEVKTRIASPERATAEQAVSARKRMHMERTACTYRSSLPRLFEQISIYINRRERRAVIKKYIIF